jgi:hypothetical protein
VSHAACCKWCSLLLLRQDFVFCKEVRLGSYSANAATLPPAAIVAAKAMAADPRAEPKHGDRVPFVVRYCCWGDAMLGQRQQQQWVVACGWLSS